MQGIKKIKKKSYVQTRYVPFGNFILNHFKLKSGVLLVKYPKSIAPVPKIKATPISDELKSLLTDLIDTQVINTDIQKTIKMNEIKLFESLLLLSGLLVHLGYKRYDRTIDDLVERFEILRGGVAAGVQSDEVKTELIQIIKIFSEENVNKISKEDANEFIEMFS